MYIEVCISSPSYATENLFHISTFGRNLKLLSYYTRFYAYMNSQCMYFLNVFKYFYLRNKLISIKCYFIYLFFS